MKLQDPEQFNFKEVEIFGDACWLITPNNMSTKWTDENFRFRSCLVRQEDNLVISQGWGKFTNYGERPDFQPWDDNQKFEARHKLDGSLLIVSRYKGQWILRTRGTVDARQLNNGHEIDFLMKKYDKFFSSKFADNGDDCSILFEWTTPNNIIVLREHDEPTLTLLGIVNHSDCSYWRQDWLDRIVSDTEVYSQFNRPVKYEYNSIAECIADVKAWQGKEGVVIYDPTYQTMKKIKGDAYCELHKISTGLVTLENVLDLFLATPMFAKYSDFYHYVETTKDYEVAEKIKDQMLVICVAYSKILDRIEKVKNVVNQVRNGFTRKEQAYQFQIHWSDWRLAVAFTLLDNRELTLKHYKTAILAEI
jgi:hypothetical protein